MKTRTLIAANVVLGLAAVMPLLGADTTQLFARSGSKIRIEGTSNIHDWQVEGKLIFGSMEVGPNFPLEPGQAATPGKVEAHADPIITVRGLKSLEKDGRPYSDAMDDRMYEAMRVQDNPRIIYHLTDLTLKESAKSKDAPYLFEAKGDLAVAGVTNKITMPVSVLPLGDKKLKISGTTTVKMTDFKIEPPAPKIALGMIKTGDDVKLIFDWMVAPRTPPTAAASK